MTNQRCSTCSTLACRNGTRKGRQQWYCSRCDYWDLDKKLPEKTLKCIYREALTSVCLVSWSIWVSSIF